MPIISEIQIKNLLRSYVGSAKRETVMVRVYITFLRLPYPCSLSLFLGHSSNSWLKCTADFPLESETYQCNYSYMIWDSDHLQIPVEGFSFHNTRLPKSRSGGSSLSPCI